MAAKRTKSPAYRSSWYALTTNRLLVTLGSLQGEINCDVCVVGGGFTGVSAALELAQKGYAVVLLEKGEIAGGAPGKNGGQIVRGYDLSPVALARRHGEDAAKLMCNMTLESLALVLERINRHEIKCGLKFGHVTAARGPRHEKALRAQREEWARIGHTDLEYIGRARLFEFVRCEAYTGGLYDPKGAHLHPLNYALGVTQAAQKAGCRVFDHTPVVELDTSGPSPRVMTPYGQVNAKFVVLGGTVTLPGAERLARRSIHAMQHIIATAPLPQGAVADILPADIAVSEAPVTGSYFHLTPDRRMIFGGMCNITRGSHGREDEKLKKRMAELFPRLARTTLHHCWPGRTEIMPGRMPHIGRLTPQVYFAHGFGGHGILSANMAGKVIAEAVAGHAGRFDMFERIRHVSIPAGNLLKGPVFTLAMIWWKLRDLL